MEFDIKLLKSKVNQWLNPPETPESTTAETQPPKEKSVRQTIFNPPAVTVVFRNTKEEEMVVKQIADIYINRHAYTPVYSAPVREEKEYLKFEHIQFDKLEKITL